MTPLLLPLSALLLALQAQGFPEPLPRRPKTPKVLPPGSSAPKPKESRLPVARLTILGVGVERADESGVFKNVSDGDRSTYG